MIDKNYLTLKEASALLNRSYWALREDIIAGRLAAIRFSSRGKYYLRPSDIDAFIGRNRSRAVGE